jgi:hypothetical protein
MRQLLKPLLLQGQQMLHSFRLLFPAQGNQRVQLLGSMQQYRVQQLLSVCWGLSSSSSRLSNHLVKPVLLQVAASGQGLS